MHTERYKWWVVVMLWFVCLFNYADRQAIFSVFPLLQAEMGLSDVQLGIVGGAFMWVYALALPLAGLVGDRIERRTLILGGLIFWSLITLATAFSTRYWHLVVFRALEGLGEAFYFPASMALISDYHGRATRSRAMALHQSSVYAGTIAGGTAAGFFGQYYGWRSGFYLFGILGVLLGLVLLGALREPARGQAEGVKPAWGPEEIAEARPDGRLGAFAELLRTPMVLILMAVFVGANFVAAIFLTWMPTFLTRKFGMSLSIAGLNGTAWLQVASVLGVLSGGVLADRWARQRRGGRMLTQALGLFAGVPFLFLTGWTLSVPVLVLAMVGFGLFKGLYDANIWASLYDVVEPSRRASALGLMNAIGWVGGAVAPVAIAIAAQRLGMSACLAATSLIYLLFGSLLVVGVRTFMQPQPPRVQPEIMGSALLE
ncbi:MAG: MFS transporter [Isosphaeraceae bacterium]|nr:MFS transporter [Isosphaeraceae bacterium]